MIKQITIAIIFTVAMAIAAIPQTAIAGTGQGRLYEPIIDDLRGNRTRTWRYPKKYKQKSKKRSKKRRRSKRTKRRDSVATPVSTAEVKVQQALQTAGFYHGPLDGKLDSYDSSVAVMQFQQSHGMPQTGKLSPDLKGVLLQQGDIAELTGYLHNTGTTQEENGKRLQAALKVQGFYTATIDGDFGPKSRDAMRLYQQSNGVTPSGALLPAQEQELVAASIQLLHNQQTQANLVLKQLGARNPSQKTVPPMAIQQQPASEQLIDQESVAEEPPSIPLQVNQPDIQQVLSAQLALNERGYQVGTPDGVYGSGTREAIINFQKSEGLEQSGELNPETLAALGVIDSLAVQADASAPVIVEEPRTVVETVQEKQVVEIATLTELTELKVEPDVFSETMAELPAGTQVAVNSIEGDWAHVTVNGQQGFVYAESLVTTNKE